MYTIIVHNNQGASDRYTGRTQADISRWLDGWGDPQNLSAEVLDEHGETVVTKEMGKKRINWPKRRGRPLAGAEPRRAIEVTLMPSTIDKLRKLGAGSVSAGIENIVAAP